MLYASFYGRAGIGALELSPWVTTFMPDVFTEPKVHDLDRDLIHRLAEGDQLALRSLYNRHHVRIHRFLNRMMRSSAGVDDVLTEVFMDVWKQAMRFEGRSSANTWLCAIARNKALAYMRKYPPPVDVDDMAEMVDDRDTPEVELQKTDKGAKLRQCIEKLGEEHRIVVDLVYYHDKSIEEVALILDILPATVKTRMFYGRKKLSVLLAEAGIDRGWP